MAPIRRPAVAAAPPPVEGFNFGDMDLYAGGFTLPEGEYAMEFDVRMHAGTKADGSPSGAARLGVMITAHPLRGGEPIPQFMSMGSNAHLSFAPNPVTGKGVVVVPGGAGANPNNKTNWFLFLKSLYDCGLPKGIFTNDLTTIDGVWVRTQNIPEPEERKGFGASKTGEAQQEERKAGLVPLVSEILDGGKPWEGSGGFDFTPAAAAPVAVARPAFAARAAAPVAAARRPAAVAAPVAEVAADDADVFTAAINGATEVLTKNPAGVTKLLMRTGTFKAVNEKQGAEMAQAVIDSYFGSDDALNTVLGQLGFAVVGTSIKPA